VGGGQTFGAAPVRIVDDSNPPLYEMGPPGSQVNGKMSSEKGAVGQSPIIEKEKEQKLSGAAKKYNERY